MLRHLREYKSSPGHGSLWSKNGDYTEICKEKLEVDVIKRYSKNKTM